MLYLSSNEEKPKLETGNWKLENRNWKVDNLN